MSSVTPCLLSRLGLLVLGLRGLLLSSFDLLEPLQRDMRSVLFRIVDILAVVPVPGGHCHAMDIDCAGPGGTASWRR
jgi:hypothetical protein